MIRERIAEINKRLKELDTELDSADAERIDGITQEARTLKEERATLTSKMAEEARAGFESGTQMRAPVAAPKRAEEDALSNMSKRDKLAYVLGKHARGKKFTEVETRALGVALTTTATTFVEATSSVEGVNNAGVFIKTGLLLDFLREEGLISPIVNDVNFTSIPGLVDFPYRASRDKARAKQEGKDGKDNQMEWAKLTGTKGFLQTIIPVTDEVQALTDFDFGGYIVSQMMQDFSEDWGEEVIYGSASNDRIKGITFGATPAVNNGYANGKVLDAVIAGIKLCKGRFRRGAKIYAAQDVIDSIAFSLGDNGEFRHPVFNNTAGVSSVGPLRVVEDENLNEGEFIIGNVGRYFKLNMLIPLRVETERKARKAVTEYIASAFCASVPFPGAFIHGFKA